VNVRLRSNFHCLKISFNVAYVLNSELKPGIMDACFKFFAFNCSLLTVNYSLFTISSIVFMIFPASTRLLRNHALDHFLPVDLNSIV